MTDKTDKAGQPPQFIDIPGLSNFRDVGGWPISDDSAHPRSRVRRGIFYRGADPIKITAAGVTKLREVGITTDFDLRSKGQIEKLGGSEPLEGIKRVWAPVFPDGEYSPEKAAARYVQYASAGTEGIVEAFTDILTHGAPACRAMLLHVASMDPKSPTGFYIHCTTGNNRSGVFVGVILSFLGVRSELVAEEYALSDIGLRPTRDAAVARLMKSPVFSGDGDGGRARAERMVAARPESMLAMLDMVEKKWGSADGYVREICGLTDEEIDRLKRVLIQRDLGHRKRVSSVWDIAKNLLTRLRSSFN